MPDAAAEYLDAARQAGQACLEAALDHLRRGWSSLAVCPPDHVGVGKTHGWDCDSPGKAPWGPWKQFQTCLPAEMDIRQKWRDNPYLNAGVALGPVSGMIGLDVDGPEGEAKLQELSGGDLPDTLEFASGRDGGGRRLLYQIPPGIRLRTTHRKGGEKHDAVSFLGQGAQTVMPPSRHVSGRMYAWKKGHGPDEIEAALAPAWLVLLMAESTSGNGESKLRAQPLTEGEKILDGHRDTTLTSLAGTMRRRGIGARAIEAALLVENEERCEPPLSESQVAKIARSVGRYLPAEDAGVRLTSGREAKDIILDHFRILYQPVFRRGEVIYSQALGREVKRSEACYGADSPLIEELKQAANAPRDKDGVRINDLPKLFSSWSRTAWADLLASLPEEDQTEGEVADMAQEEFRRAVAAGLYRIVSFGQTHEVERTRNCKTETETQTRSENRSVIDWCCIFAKTGNWAKVRSLLVWTRREPPATGTDPKGRLCVALRADVFGQLPGSPLAKMDQRRFAALAQQYGVGVARECRPGGARALELTSEFIAELLDGPGMTQGGENHPLAHARGNTDSASYQEDSPC